MAAVPLPDVPCVRVKLDYSNSALEAGSRFYLSYSGAAPTGANCTTLAGDIAAEWAGEFGPIVNPNFALVEVDVLDIATNSGLSGQWNGTHTGAATGTPCPSQCCFNIEFNIARRYRGGKPRMYLPPGTNSGQITDSLWSTGTVGTVNTATAAFFAYLEGLSIGSMGTLNHVNLSYYKGFTNYTSPSGREKSRPTYRATAQHDNVVGYSTKQLIGSQKRRRSATSF